MANDKQIITQAARKYGIDPKILWGLYGTETSFGKNVSRSSAGAVGPFQFLPSTAKSMGVNPNDFRSAAFGAARYLSQYKGRGVGGMLSAYNAGPAGGYQSGYVQSTLKNAQSYGGMPGRGVGQTIPAGPPIKIPGTPARQEATFDTQSFQKAQKASLIGKLIASTEGTKDNPLIASGLATTRPPERSEFEGSRTIPGTPAQTIPGAPRPGGTKLGGFLAASAPLKLNRIDQGQDIQTRPGEALLAPGEGVVVAVKSDPSGFGPDYPVVKFTSGPLAGQSWYLGHTDSALRQGEHFRAGQPIARTSKTGHNAPAGWAEIGFASALGQGIHGQGAATRRYLR